MPRVKQSPNPDVQESIESPMPEKGEGNDSISLDFDHDAENGTVSFTLSNGIEITVREPKAIDFLRVKGWRDNAREDDKSSEMAAYKMVSLCTTSFKKPGEKSPKTTVSVYELIDCLETQKDLLMTANCLDFFRNTISRLSGQPIDIQVSE